VDEYQDVNPVQEAIGWSLHELGARICVVGDDDQTVYQWRGSDVKSILTFDKRYPGVEQIPLEENFRSSEGIVETARAFIEQNSARLTKAMKPTGAQPYESGDIVALSFSDPEAEARYIAKTIQSHRGVAFKEGDVERGLSWSDMAILLRSVRANAEPITQALQAAGIRFVVTGMTTLFGTAEAEAARQLFYFIADRPGVDAAALKAAWEAASLGIGPAALDQAVAGAAAAKAALTDPDQKRWGQYSIQRVFLTFLEQAGGREELIPDGRGEIVFYNLGKFSQVISDFETIHYQSKPVEKYDSFADFLQHRAEDAYPEGWQDNQYANPDAVRIMTIHQAKGMQWPVVFVPALLRNRFPAARIGGRERLAPAAPCRYPRAGALRRHDRGRAAAVLRRDDAQPEVPAPDLGADFRQEQPVRGAIGVLDRHPGLEVRQAPHTRLLDPEAPPNAPIHEALGYGKSPHDALAEVHARAICVLRDARLPQRGGEVGDGGRGQGPGRDRRPDGAARRRRFAVLDRPACPGHPRIRRHAQARRGACALPFLPGHEPPLRARPDHGGPAPQHLARGSHHAEPHPPAGARRCRERAAGHASGPDGDQRRLP
jgi:DNA helicase-2/ATP-dependent DNA helicase PcrA